MVVQPEITNGQQPYVHHKSLGLLKLSNQTCNSDYGIESRKTAFWSLLNQKLLIYFMLSYACLQEYSANSEIVIFLLQYIPPTVTVKMTNKENAHVANMSFTTIRNTKVAPEDIPRYPLTGGKCVRVVPNSHDPRPDFTDGQYNTRINLIGKALRTLPTG